MWGGVELVFADHNVGGGGGCILTKMIWKYPSVLTSSALGRRLNLHKRGYYEIGWLK